MASPTTPFQGQQLAQLASASGASTILELKSGIAWRQFLRRASFGNAQFYVDTVTRDSGRRIVLHEFPKRDAPYAEDMGMRAREITIRGYLIVYPATGSQNQFANDPLKQASYLDARDALIKALETEGAQTLQTPLLGQLVVVCSRYRITEEDRLGGYCVFDMTFNEYGQAPATGTRNSVAGVTYAAQTLGTTTQSGITNGLSSAGAINA